MLVSVRSLCLLLPVSLLLAALLSGCALTADSPDARNHSASLDAAADATHSGYSAADVSLGARSARARGCFGCHDDGDGVPAGRLEPLLGSRAFPSNLTPDRATGLGGWSDASIARAIRDGLDQSGDPLCAVMPRYDKLDATELRALVAWMRSLPAVDREIPASACAAGESLVDSLDGGARSGDAAPAWPDGPDPVVASDLSTGANDALPGAPRPDLHAVDAADLCRIAVPDLTLPGAPDLRSSDAGALPDAGAPPCVARVNELQTTGLGGATDEFIELYNPCPASVDLEAAQLVYRSAAGVVDVVLLKLPAIKLAAGGRLVVGSANFAGVADLRYGGGLAGDGGGVALRDKAGAILDHVGWGNAHNAFVRGVDAPAPPAQLSIGRHPDGAASGDDARDFVVNVATPGKPNK